MRGSLSVGKLTGTGAFSGKHSYQDVFLLVNNRRVVTDMVDEPSVAGAGKVIKSPRSIVELWPVRRSRRMRSKCGRSSQEADSGVYFMFAGRSADYADSVVVQGV
jgi:hypothetical protein